MEDTVSFSLEKTVAHLITEQIDEATIDYKIETGEVLQSYYWGMGPEYEKAVLLSITAGKEKQKITICSLYFLLSGRLKIEYCYLFDNNGEKMSIENAQGMKAFEIDTDTKRKMIIKVHFAHGYLYFYDGMLGFYNTIWLSHCYTNQLFVCKLLKELMVHFTREKGNIKS